jgi:cytochrome c556
MHRSLHRSVLALTAAGAVLLSPLGSAHFDDKEIPQSYRQSFFALVAANFGPMAAMVKGDMPWDQERMEDYADDLDTLLELDLLRGFQEGSDKGTTRAKPEIWQNKADFESKLEDLRKAADMLDEVAEGGDREAIAKQVGATGEACKACHDEYKAKNYLY